MCETIHVYVCVYVRMYMQAFITYTTCAHAQSGVKQLLVLSVCHVSVCHQNFGLITTTKGLNTSICHSNNDNLVHGVPEGG